MYKVIVSILRFIFKIIYRQRIVNKSRLDFDGAMIFCGNHSHNFDAIFVAINSRRTINFMAKKELFANKFFTWFFKTLHAIPVSRDGNDLYSLKLALKALKSGEVLGIFPQGRREDGLSLQTEFKPGISILAVKTKTPVIPIYISENKRLFSKIDIVVGEPIELSEYYDKKLTNEEYVEIAQSIILKSILDLEESAENANNKG